MKNNAFTDILLNWETMSAKKKLQRMQDFENMIARFQERKPRKISIKPKKEILDIISKDRLPEACYARNDSEYLYVFDLSMSAIDVLKNIIHEGFHAYVHDFVTGKAKTLKTYSEVYPEIFYIQEENLPAIHDEFVKRNMMPLFDSFFIEEKINYNENSIYLVKHIMDSIESVQDAIKLQQDFVFSLAFSSDNMIRGRDLEKKYKTTFDEVVVDALNSSNDEKDRVKKGRIISDIDPELRAFVMKACEKYTAFSCILKQKSMLMSEKGRKEASDKILDEITKMYRDYVMSKIMAKKKY